MAMIGDFCVLAGRAASNAPMDGTVCSSTGSSYHVATSAQGVVSCSCLSWLYPKPKSGQKAPAIGERFCKHLRGLRDGMLVLTQSATKSVTAARTAEVSEGGFTRKYGAE